MILFAWSPVTPAQFAQGFDNIRAELRDMSEPLDRSINNVMVGSLEQNFISEGRPSWLPLAAYTVAKKGSTNILDETGNLESQATDPGSWDIGTNDAQLVGIDDYGVYQNDGFYNVPFDTVVPAREWALFQPQDEDEIVEVFWDWLEEVVERSLP